MLNPLGKLRTSQHNDTEASPATLPEQAAATNLSFSQRWFTKPLPTSISTSSSTTSISTQDRQLDSEKKGAQSAQAPRRKFSFLSRGFIILAAAIVMTIAIVLIVVLAVTLTNNKKVSHPVFQQPSGSSQPPSAASDANGFDGPIPTLSSVPPSTSSEPSTALVYAYSQPPIRLGILANFPDPTIYYDAAAKLWYAIATNNAAGVLKPANGNITKPEDFSSSNLQMATSPDFKTWNLMTEASDPLPHPGVWAAQGNANPSLVNGRSLETIKSGPTTNLTSDATIPVPLAAVWSPDILQRPSDKQWVLYYAAADGRSPHTHCIGAATSSSAAGPYNATTVPLACPVDQGGAIDPAGFIDPVNNTIYVVYKIDGNSIGHGGSCGNTVAPIVPTPIMLQKMKDDGVTLDGAPVQLLDRIAEDGPLIEAPDLVKAGDTYFLFYSSGCTRNPSYKLRYATAKNIAGPYTRSTHNPLLQTGDYELLAPGSLSVRWANDTNPGNEVIGSDGGTWKMALHGRVQNGGGGVRAMFTAGMVFENDVVSLVNGSLTTLG